jgi:hypothetical protein
MINENSSIFTTGAFAQPVEMKDYKGNPMWRWVITGFEDDSYFNGESCSPVVSAETCEGLLLPDVDDDVDDVIVDDDNDDEIENDDEQ